MTGTPKSPLPSGHLHVVGNHMVDGNGNNVSIACSGYNEPTGNHSSNMSIMRNQGFNCARYDLYGVAILPGRDLQLLDFGSCCQQGDSKQ